MNKRSYRGSSISWSTFLSFLLTSLTSGGDCSLILRFSPLNSLLSLTVRSLLPRDLAICSWGQYGQE